MNTTRRYILFLSVAVSAFGLGVFLTYLLTFRPVQTECRLKLVKIEDPPVPTETEPLRTEPIRKPLDQSIRKIDFNNFTYNWFPKNDNIFKKRIVLRNGENKEVHLEGKKYGPLGEDYQEQMMNISYADLTGDGKEEAIVTVGVSLYRWTPMCIYIFSERNKKAVQLFKYEVSKWGTDLDFRGLSINNGRLVIDEFDTAGEPNCCAKRYFRKTIGWNGKTFEEKNLEIFPNEIQSKQVTGFPIDTEVENFTVSPPKNFENFEFLK